MHRLVLKEALSEWRQELDRLGDHEQLIAHKGSVVCEFIDSESAKHIFNSEGESDHANTDT